MKSTKLPNAPLKEVSFEVRWGIGNPNPSLLNRMESIVGLAKFIELIQPQFPMFRQWDSLETIPSYQVAYQFRKSPDEWPLVQFGPGVMTVNDNNSEYDWPGRFFPLIKTCLDYLSKAHESVHGVVITEATIKYIDAVKLADHKGSRANLEEFIKSKFNLSIATQITGASIVNMQSRFEIMVGGVPILLKLSTGNLGGEDAIIWESYITYSYKNTGLDGVIESADQAHTVLSAFFKSLCTQSFLDEFADN